MKYTYLGKSGLKVSRLILGTVNFGIRTDEKECFRIMDRALDAGINFFDTANVYGMSSVTPNTYFGLTEEIMGRWFAQGGNRREKVVLSSKVYGKMDDANIGPNDEPGLSSYKIKRHLEDSLRRLQTDHLELYNMHFNDPRTTWDEIWGAFIPLVEQGKIDYVGSSNFASRHLVYAQNSAKQRNFMGLISEQCHYGLANRNVEMELVPTAIENGIGIICYSPLGGGMLSGHVASAGEGTRGYKVYKNMTPAQKKQVEDYSALCRELGENEAEVALAWLLHQPGVVAPIIGPRTVEQLESCLRATEIELDDKTLKRLDEIFPGPGQAPKIY